MKAASVYLMIPLLSAGLCVSGCTRAVKMVSTKVVRASPAEERVGYVIPQRVQASVHQHIATKQKYPREVYSLSYMGHMKGLVYVYIHHRDEGTEKTNNLRGSLYDFFVGIDEDSGEVRAEGALQ
jgi:hypothetical protein